MLVSFSDLVPSAAETILYIVWLDCCTRESYTVTGRVCISRWQGDICLLQVQKMFNAYTCFSGVRRQVLLIPMTWYTRHAQIIQENGVVNENHIFLSKIKYLFIYLYFFGLLCIIDTIYVYKKNNNNRVTLTQHITIDLQIY